jgi:hypothetical protein
VFGRGIRLRCDRCERERGLAHERRTRGRVVEGHHDGQPAAGIGERGGQCAGALACHAAQGAELHAADARLVPRRGIATERYHLPLLALGLLVEQRAGRERLCEPSRVVEIRDGAGGGASHRARLSGIVDEHGAVHGAGRRDRGGVPTDHALEVSLRGTGQMGRIESERAEHVLLREL